ncbi:unnamed protein product, partial [Didymodactylos carnosus]
YVIYNRVPKCASETIRFVFREQANARDFSILNSRIYAPFDYNDTMQQKIISNIFKLAQPALYERHMYFIDFTAFQKPQPVYINVIRDPLQRAISDYYFTRATYDCVKKYPELCLKAIQGVSNVVPFFCGQHPDCQRIDDWSLKRAKQNINQFYTVIGITEDLYKFFYVLEKLLPLYFKNVCLLYMKEGSERAENQLYSKYKKKPSNDTIAILRRYLTHEYDLYDYVKSRFYTQYRQLVDLDKWG